MAATLLSESDNPLADGGATLGVYPVLVPAVPTNGDQLDPSNDV
jgi:hypothetical protein